MFIGAANKNNILAPGTEVAHINICRKVATGNMPYVKPSIGIRQCSSNGMSFKCSHESEREDNAKSLISVHLCNMSSIESSKFRYFAS